MLKLLDCLLSTGKVFDTWVLISIKTWKYIGRVWIWANICWIQSLHCMRLLCCPQETLRTTLLSLGLLSQLFLRDKVQTEKATLQELWTFVELSSKLHLRTVASFPEAGQHSLGILPLHANFKGKPKLMNLLAWEFVAPSPIPATETTRFPWGWKQSRLQALWTLAEFLNHSP